jgi:hypothetical protein
MNESSLLSREIPGRGEVKSFKTNIFDSEYRESIGSLEEFKKNIENQPILLTLDEVEHSIDKGSVLEHTYKVIRNIETDKLRNIKIEGISVSLTDLVRTVALYHDYEKATGGTKRDALNDIFRELEGIQPELLKNEADKALFAILLETSSYFGYNTKILSIQNPKQRAEAIQALIESQVDNRVENLEEEYNVVIDPLDLLSIQYVLSRADTLGIVAYKDNINKINRLFKLIKEYF